MAELNQYSQIVNLRDFFEPILKRNGWNVSDLATHCGYTAAGLYSAFRNNDAPLSTIVLMCDVCGVEIGELVKNRTE